MYSLLVTSNANAWNGDPFTFERSRCISPREYTDDDIAMRFDSLSASQVDELRYFPSVFAYETGRGQDPHFGFIREIIVQKEQARVKLKYALVECPGFVTADELESLASQLGIGQNEMGRTHWAVKDVDLARVLRDERGVSLPQWDYVVPRVGPRVDERPKEDLWDPPTAPRVFISHSALRKKEVHDLSENLKHFGFACFVAHDMIEPSRERRREIERALNSCDLLLAYVTPEFAKSSWTDQETGWALGRGLATIPISVDGATPYGFIGSYQAVRRTVAMSMSDLSMLVFRAICDVVFNARHPLDSVFAEKVTLCVADALALARDENVASLCFELVMKAPERFWRGEYENRLRMGLQQNEALLSRTSTKDRSTTIAQLLRERLDTQRPS